MARRVRVLSLLSEFTLLFVLARAASTGWQTAFLHGPKPTCRIRRGKELAKVIAQARLAPKLTQLGHHEDLLGKKGVGMLGVAASLLLRARCLQQEARELEKDREASKREASRSRFHSFAGSSSNVTAVQLQKGLLEMGVDMDLQHSQIMLKRYDINRDGELSFSEFSALFEHHDETLAQIKAEEAEAEREQRQALRQERERAREVEMQVKWLESLPLGVQLPLSALCTFSAAAYLLPIIDIFRLWTYPHTPFELDIMQANIFLFVAFLAASRSVPKPIGFHLNQAFFLDMMLQLLKVVHTCCTSAMVIGGGSFAYLHLGMKAVVCMSAMGIFYFLASALLSVPADLPLLSTEARCRSETRNRAFEEEEQWCREFIPRPSWFPLLGFLAFSVVICDYWLVLLGYLCKHSQISTQY